MMTPGKFEAARARRLFFALWPEPELQERFYRFGGRVLGDSRARRVPSENLHLTLAFLGWVNEERHACCERAAGAVRATAVTLTLDRVGCFRRNGILWIGPSQLPPALIQLVRMLGEALVPCGIEPEARDYRAHLTLARHVRRCPPEQPMAPVAWELRRFVLVESHTGPAGARYEILRSWDLSG